MLGKFFLITAILIVNEKFAKSQEMCTATSCSQNGVCEIKENKIVCKCKSGFVGSKCQLIDPCLEKPCGANGACFSLLSNSTVPGQMNLIEKVSYHCQCYSGFSGQNCQNIPAKPCNSNPCLNGANCVNQVNTYDYYCICVGAYTGKDCGTYIDVCENNKCKNDAICIPGFGNHNYTCSCRNGFYGTYCEIEIDECKIISNGMETNPCKNNGTCYDLIDAYYCECQGPFAGPNCETSILTGTGNDFNSLFLPVILPVVSGALLPILPGVLTYYLLKKDVNPCDKNPCGQGSVCVPNAGSFICQCGPGFFGNPCQPNPCISNPCKKPGSQCVPVEAGAMITFIPNCTCVNPDPSYVCVCPSTNPPYASMLC